MYISRYVVAAMDPAYGRALTIAVLEPDYSEDPSKRNDIKEQEYKDNNHIITIIIVNDSSIQ